MELLSVGVAHRGPTHDMTSNQWNQVLAVNLMAPIQLVREFLPSLRSHETQNVCSEASRPLLST